MEGMLKEMGCQARAGLTAPVTGTFLPPAEKFTREKNGWGVDPGLRQPERPGFGIHCKVFSCFVFLPLESFVPLSWAGLGRTSRSQGEADRLKWRLPSTRSQRLLH